MAGPEHPVSSSGSRTPFHKVAVGAAAAGISAIGGAVLTAGSAPQQSTLVFVLSFLAWMVLVALATVVGTVWAEPAVGLLAGAPPLLVIWWFVIAQETDAQAGIAFLIVMLLALGASGAAWGTTFALMRRREERRQQPR